MKTHRGRSTTQCPPKGIDENDGKPIRTVGQILADFQEAHPAFGPTMGAAEYRRRRLDLVLELDGIGAWISEGARRPVADAGRN